MQEKNIDGTFNGEILGSIFRTSKKVIQEYVAEIERTNRYKSVRSDIENGAVLDDRSRLIDLYEACLQQDAHIRAVIETLVSQILGDRYMLARQNEKGKYIKDVAQTRKIQGSQFDKIIRGIVEAKLFGYTLLEIMPDIDLRTGKLAVVNIIERRNVLADQRRVVKRQGRWSPGWDLTQKAYSRNYVLVNTGDIGLFSATTPLILAKKFTVANYVNFSHTYGQPIIHGKTVSESNADRKRLATDIANAAQNKVLVTGLDDEIDIKTFTMSNSEKIYTGLIEFVNSEVSNMILGSESMAGATQSYVGSTKAHQDIFRERIEVYRRFIENVMNEEVVPRLVEMGYIASGLEFKYSNRIEMNNEDRIKLYGLITDKYEVTADEIEKEFGIHVGRQLNAVQMGGSATGASGGLSDRHIMTDEEYYKRYGRQRGSRVANFLRDVE
jgi:phage gp29-like protein